MNNKWGICQSAKPTNAMNGKPIESFVFGTHLHPRNRVHNQFINGDAFHALPAGLPFVQSGLNRRFIPQTTDSLNLLPTNINKSLRTTQHPKITLSENNVRSNNFNSAFENTYPYSPESRSEQSPLPRIGTSEIHTTSPSPYKKPTLNDVYNDFIRGLDELERKFYSVTLDKLTAISPINRKENGISFVQSGLFLMLSLMALLFEVDLYTREEIENCINIHLTESAKLSSVTENILALFPSSSNDLKFRWSNRLILWPNHTVSDEFKTGPAAALRMHIDTLNGTETPEKIAEILNNMVEIDSGGSIRNTFEEDDLAEGAQAILLTTLYLRGRWRSAPTVLNGSRPFRDTENSPTRSIRCIRINDVMRYADLTEWDAEVLLLTYL
ncbi:hypothetical protein O3G_MSEX008247 [Manduca sexta]|uniref:Serpin domain-containing protein n=1 Tax=Manduca sexta TaxID=7130 RepID=A0A921ZA65_MANSE|nr:hypothetical protein O3G_MSEX008247 [Manduca sexta]